VKLFLKNIVINIGLPFKFSWSYFLLFHVDALPYHKYDIFSPEKHICNFFQYLISTIGCSFKFLLKVGVEKSIVDAPRITVTDHQLFKSNLTFCVLYVFTQQTDEWCVHNRLFNANFEEKFK
jgi:hypothetical protein